MKIRIVDRVLLAIIGLLLIIISAGLYAELVIGMPVTAWLAMNLADAGKILPSIVAVVLLLLAAYCMIYALSTSKGKSGFVQQETDGGELSIALPAIESLVCQCVQVHEEMELVSSQVKNDRDGIRVDLQVTLSTGVSVPLAVDALQKQIRQYVTSCSGVTVHEICVQVDSMENQAVETPYAVPSMLAAAVPMLPRSEAEAVEKEDKLMHQRIFSTEEAPVQQEAPAEEATEAEQPAQEAAEEPAEEEAVVEMPEEAEVAEGEAAAEETVEAEAHDETAAEEEIVTEETEMEADPVDETEPEQVTGWEEIVDNSCKAAEESEEEENE